MSRRARCRRTSGSSSSENAASGAATGRSVTAPPCWSGARLMALRVREAVTVVRGHRPRNNTRAAGIGRGGREPAMLDRAVAHTAHIRTTGGRMVGLLLRLRWLGVVIAVCGALHSLAFTAMGVIRGY